MPVVFPDIWRLHLTVPPESLPVFEEVFDDFAESTTMFMDDRSGMSDGDCLWHLEGFSRTCPDRMALTAALAAIAAAQGCELPTLTIEQLPNLDWVSANLQDFPPIFAGRFFIRGSHWDGNVPPSLTQFRVDARAAFGSGEHATTKGCLSALDRLAKRKRFLKPLDLGCGSGILAIAMAKLWSRPVLATDIDPSSVKVARNNARLNEVGALVHCAVSDGWRNPVLRREAPFDLICANILARPLMRFAPAMAAHLSPHGVAVLSGLLERQERMVLNAYQRQGLTLRERLVIDGWSTLIIGR